MKRFALLLALTACEEQRTVTLLLGPDDHTLTAGFACRAESGELLIEHARAGGTYRFQVVIDTVALGATFPGCRGEEIVASCNDGDCARISRFCASIQIPQAELTSPTAVLAALHAQLGHHELIADAPDTPIVVRAVTTLQSCDDLMPAAGVYPRLDAERAVGCAYSCPVILDELSGSLGMALDTLDDHCANQVRACARFGG